MKRKNFDQNFIICCVGTTRVLSVELYAVWSAILEACEILLTDEKLSSVSLETRNICSKKPLASPFHQTNNSIPSQILYFTHPTHITGSFSEVVASFPNVLRIS